MTALYAGCDYICLIQKGQNMKFIVSSSALLKQLQQINGVIGSNNVLPILEDFLFEIETNKLTFIITCDFR